MISDLMRRLTSLVALLVYAPYLQVGNGAQARQNLTAINLNDEVQTVQTGQVLATTERWRQRPRTKQFRGKSPLCSLASA